MLTEWRRRGQQTITTLGEASQLNLKVALELVKKSHGTLRVSDSAQTFTEEPRQFMHGKWLVVPEGGDNLR